LKSLFYDARSENNQIKLLIFNVMTATGFRY